MIEAEIVLSVVGLLCALVAAPMPWVRHRPRARWWLRVPASRLVLENPS